MARPKHIRIPIERPRICLECPLLGTLPEGEREGKFTHVCLLPSMHRRRLSGRVTKAEDVRRRKTCKDRQYAQDRTDYSGDIPVATNLIERYNVSQTRFIFEVRKD